MRRLSPFFLLILLPFVLACDKRPTFEDLKPKRRGDNGYRLFIGGNPKGYEPGKTYNIFLLGQRTHERLQQFTHFTLTARASRGPSRKSHSSIAGPRRIGRFQLFSDSLTKFNENCVNTVSEADDFPKTEIQVLWVAPAAGSGCVALSAMVLENINNWYSDDGELTKVICEAKPEEKAQKYECCACDEAKYNFVFEGIWSNETHPKDFPFAVWLTHFSDVIGASHDTDFSFWGENHIATDGFRSLAEWGSPRALEQELRAKSPRLKSLIKAAGLWYPDVNTNTTSNFRTDRKHHKVSMVSMFGPSPDWVVGVSGLNLCKADCSWEESLDVDLFPWDAGTDNGISYMSPNAETIPRERMTRITTMYPEDPRAPFYNPKSNKMTPLAKLYIRREKVIPKSCDADFLMSQLLEESENTEEEVRPECETTHFSQWSACSVTCGKGIRMRNRRYKNPSLAAQANCNRQLVTKEMCVASVAECEGDKIEDTETLSRVAATQDTDGEGTGICRTTKWSEWSPCSSSCGIGITMRTRTFVDHQGRKKCPHITIVEKEKCMKPDCEATNMEAPDAMCPTTIWSDWSPCSVSCGKGVQIRSRLLLVEPEMKETCSKRVVLNEQRPCAEQADCSISPAEANEICRMPAETGPCRSEYIRFAYQPQRRSCVGFTYGGCRGNRNNFLTEEDCLSTCQNVTLNEENFEVEATNSKKPVDCVLSDWSQWSPCSATCGIGRSEKYRDVLRQAENGGKPCPERRIVKRRRCYAPAC